MELEDQEYRFINKFIQIYQNNLLRGSYKIRNIKNQ